MNVELFQKTQTGYCWKQNNNQINTQVVKMQKNQSYFTVISLPRCKSYKRPEG